MKDRYIKFIVAEPLREARTCVLKNDIIDFQMTLGGPVGLLPLAREDNAFIGFNDDQMIREVSCTNNEEIYILYGTIIIVGFDISSGKFTNLTDQQIQKYINLFSDTTEHSIDKNKIIYLNSDIPLLILKHSENLQ